MHLSILTDIPVWVRPLAEALRERGAEVGVAGDPAEIPPNALVVNRISTQVARRKPSLARAMERALRRFEAEPRPVVNGTRCLELGFSKLAQAGLFAQCGVRRPRTAAARAGARQFPEADVLLKPAAGGFGRGIVRLAAGEPAPDHIEPDGTRPWVEQEVVAPADGVVHRVETLGGRILYEAVSPIQPDCFDYCLAHASEDVTLRSPPDLPPALRETVARITQAVGMELGSLEYLVDGSNAPVFIDLNPVSSLHPDAAEVLGDRRKRRCHHRGIHGSEEDDDEHRAERPRRSGGRRTALLVIEHACMISCRFQISNIIVR